MRGLLAVAECQQRGLSFDRERRGGGHHVAGRQLVGRPGRNGFGCKLRLMSGCRLHRSTVRDV
jgi:hypothetical protein